MRDCAEDVPHVHDGDAGRIFKFRRPLCGVPTTMSVGLGEHLLERHERRILERTDRCRGRAARLAGSGSSGACTTATRRGSSLSALNAMPRMPTRLVRERHRRARAGRPRRRAAPRSRASPRGRGRTGCWLKAASCIVSLNRQGPAANPGPGMPASRGYLYLLPWRMRSKSRPWLVGDRVELVHRGELDVAPRVREELGQLGFLGLHDDDLVGHQTKEVSARRDRPRSSNALTIWGARQNSRRLWPSATRSGQNVTARPQAPVEEPFADLRAGARVDGAAKDEDLLVPEVRHAALERPGDGIERGVQMLVDRRAHDEHEDAALREHRRIGRAIQRARGRGSMPGESPPPPRRTASSPRSKLFDGALVDVVDEHLLLLAGDQQSERQPDVTAPTDHADVEGKILRGHLVSFLSGTEREGYKGSRIEGTPPSAIGARSPRAAHPVNPRGPRAHPTYAPEDQVPCSHWCCRSPDPVAKTAAVELH